MKLLALLAVCAGLATAQSEPISLSGSILGTNGLPLRKANVLLQPQGPPSRGQAMPVPYSATSDPLGQFSFTGIEPGRYILTADDTGYLRGTYGARAGIGSAIILNLAPGKTMTDMLIRLIEQSVVTGKVIDNDGDPVPRIQVRLMHKSFVNGQRQLTPSGFAQTDDIGQFRISGISPGQYYLTAEPQLGNTPRVLRQGQPRSQTAEQPVLTYFPGVSDAQSAVPIKVMAGQTIAGNDIRLLTAPAFHVRGSVTGLTGNTSRARVALNPASGGVVVGGATIGSAITKDGTFDLAGVPPGFWKIAVVNNGPVQNLGSRTIQVGGQDIEGLVLTASALPDIHGIVKMEGTGDSAPLRVMLTAADGPALNLPNVTVDAAGKFTMAGLGAGSYRVTVLGVPAGSYLKSVSLNGREVLESGMDLNDAAGELNMGVVVSQSGAELNGAVLGDDGKAAPGAVVTMIPDPPRPELAYLYQRTNTDQNGIFRIRGIAPGKYRVIAWQELEPGEQFDPDLARANEDKSLSLTLGEGEHQVMTLVSVSP
jgi:protocatechuate 3,4-dioxygenase beta subunit